MSFEIRAEDELAHLDDMAGEWNGGNGEADNNGGPAPVIRDIADLKPMESFGDVEIHWVVDGLFAEGTIIVITGKPGDGKTTLAADIAYRVSRGEPFAGRPTSKRPALILDRENPRTGMLAMFKRLGIREHPDFHVWGSWQPDDPPAPDGDVMLLWIGKCDPKPLLIVESMVAFSEGSENDATEMRAFFRRLRKLTSMGATVVLQHHPGKSNSANKYRGSSDLLAAIDLGILLANSSSTSGRLDRLTLTPFKDRLGHFRPTVFRYTPAGFVEEGCGTSQSNEPKLIELLRTNPGIQKTAFVNLAKAQGLGRNRAEAFLESLVINGSIRVEDGPRNAQLYYWIAEQNDGRF
ncbi:MAG: AAA family ATPase [Bryobacteraceae bacterium]